MESETLQKLTDLEYQINGLWALVIGLMIVLLIYYGFSIYYEYKTEKVQKEKENLKNKKNQEVINIFNKYIDKDNSVYRLYTFELTQKEKEIIKEVFNDETK